MLEDHPRLSHHHGKALAGLVLSLKFHARRLRAQQMNHQLTQATLAAMPQGPWENFGGANAGDMRSQSWESQSVDNAHWATAADSPQLLFARGSRA